MFPAHIPNPGPFFKVFGQVKQLQETLEDLTQRKLLDDPRAIEDIMRDLVDELEHSQKTHNV